MRLQHTTSLQPTSIEYRTSHVLRQLQMNNRTPAHSTIQNCSIHFKVSAPQIHRDCPSMAACTQRSTPPESSMYKSTQLRRSWQRWASLASPRLAYLSPSKQCTTCTLLLGLKGVFVGDGSTMVGVVQYLVLQQYSSNLLRRSYLGRRCWGVCPPVCLCRAAWSMPCTPARCRG